MSLDLYTWALVVILKGLSLDLYTWALVVILKGFFQCGCMCLGMVGALLMRFMRYALLNLMSDSRTSGIVTIRVFNRE